MAKRLRQDNSRRIDICDVAAKGAGYIIDGPLRRVTPYDFTYNTYTKRRWIGRTLIDIFTSEFRDKDSEYYRKKIANGEVTINAKVADMESTLKDGDLISHSTHKHEPPVSSRPIGIVHEDENIIVIDKPAGVPAHPTGRFKYNSAVNILKYEHNITCHPINRLDRLTSGLMFLAKNSAQAEKYGVQIRDREVTKEYFAMVAGVFPSPKNEFVTCEEPLSTARPKHTLNMVDTIDGKRSITKFRRISTNGKTSLVKCIPLTGRTHQIRVHLQHLGYPIANDPIYSNPKVWGTSFGKGATVQNTDLDRIAENLDRIGKDTPASSWLAPDGNGEVLTGEVCSDCEQPLYSDPGPNDLGLYLHAARYASKDQKWSYEAKIPQWMIDEHKAYLAKALEEAKKSPPLPTNYCVGACLVYNGDILETGYTNELPGNTHAEQCAIEKYRARTGEPDVPDGTVIYTTMEPCSFRLSGNLPCVDRILETSISTVFCGVVEPADFVSENNGREKLENRGIQYIHIPGMEEDILKVAKSGHEIEPSAEGTTNNSL